MSRRGQESPWCLQGVLRAEKKQRGSKRVLPAQVQPCRLCVQRADVATGTLLAHVKFAKTTCVPAVPEAVLEFTFT